MPDLTLTTLDHGTIDIASDVVSDLASSLDGGLLTPESEGYDEARSLWNAACSCRSVGRDTTSPATRRPTAG